jgi:hypothetical protein
MPELATMSLIGVFVAAVLVVVFLKVRQKDLLGALIEKRRAASRLVSRAEYMEGAESMPVALSLGTDTLYYENPDFEASFELAVIDEVEYDDELTTGKNVEPNQRVLRLRSHNRSFEFLLDKAEQSKWANALPPKTLGAAQTAHAV